MYIITGANDNHFKSLRNLINTFNSYKQVHDKIVVYNLGISQTNWDSLRSQFPFCIFYTFDYSKYPLYYNININAGEYAWKPALIKEFSSKLPKGEILIWMDSGNIITENLNTLENLVKTNSLYTPTSTCNIKDWTHKGTLDYLNTPNSISELSNRNGSCIGFDTSVNWIKLFIDEWNRYCSIKECIAPKGSSRQNHRQDQSVLSILYYNYQIKYAFNIINDYRGYDTHKDIDEPVTKTLAIVNLGNTDIELEKIKYIMDFCKDVNYDLYNNEVYLNHGRNHKLLKSFLDSIKGDYKNIFITTNEDSIPKGEITPIEFFKKCDSVQGDITYVWPSTISRLIIELVKNKDVNAVNTLGYMKNMVTPVEENRYLLNGGLFIKSNKISKIYLTYKVIDWFYDIEHFNVIY